MTCIMLMEMCCQWQFLNVRAHWESKSFKNLRALKHAYWNAPGVVTTILSFLLDNKSDNFIDW